MPDPTHALRGKAAIITGSARGLGRAYAFALAARGADVIVNDLPGDGEDPAETTAAEIRSAGGSATAYSSNVATAEGAAGLIAAAVERHGRLDVLVNNAGILRDKTIANMTEDLLQTVLDVNLTAAFHTARAAWPVMKNQGQGRIINTTSASGLFGNFGQSNYAAAKMGVVGLTRVAALEGANHGISANAVAPVAATSLTNTDAARAALKRPDQVAPLIVVLAAAPADVTGQVFLAGGGWFTRCAVVHGTGWYGAGDVTPEDLIRNWHAVSGMSSPTVPASAKDIATQMQTRWAEDDQTDAVADRR